MLVGGDSEDDEDKQTFGYWRVKSLSYNDIYIKLIFGMWRGVWGKEERMPLRLMFIIGQIRL